MKTRRTLLVVLLLMLTMTVYFGLSEHSCRRDQKRLEEVIRRDSRFREITVERMGFGLILRGQVRSRQDLTELFSNVNRIKRVRVDSSVVVSDSVKPSAQ